MFFGALIFGTVTGIAAGAITVLGLGAPLWLGLLVWWLIGTAVALAPLVVAALRRDEDINPDLFATA